MNNQFLAEGWFDRINPRCVLCTKPQRKYFESGTTHRKWLFDTHGRLMLALKRQVRTSGCSSRNGEKSNVQVELEKHLRKMFASQCRRPSIHVASTFWSFTSSWTKEVSKEKYGAWTSRRGIQRKIMWRLCVWQTDENLSPIEGRISGQTNSGIDPH